MDLEKAARMVAVARGCLGTAFHHQGRCAVSGLDCIGVVVLGLRDNGVMVRDRLDYGLLPEGDSLVRSLQDHGARLVTGEICAGDVLVFRYGGRPQHVGIAVSDDGMIHSFAPAGKVVETRLGDYWRRRLVSVYRFF